LYNNDLTELQDYYNEPIVHSPTSGFLFKDAYLVKRGNIVQLELSGLKNLTNLQDHIIINGIPSKFCPTRPLYFNVSIESEVYRIIINTDGNVHCVPYLGVTVQDNVAETLVYVV